MYSVSSAFLPALRYSHTAVSQVDLYSPDGIPLVYDLPISEGSVTVDGSSQVKRTCEITVADPRYYKLVTPYGSQVFIKRGIKYVSGAIEWIPLGYFRIESVHESWPFNGLTVSGADRAKVLVDNPFIHDDQVSDTRTVIDEIARVAADGFRLYGENYWGGYNPILTDLDPSNSLLHQPYATTVNAQNYYQDTQPAGTGFGIGDSWYDTSNNFTRYSWSGSAWVLAPTGITTKFPNLYWALGDSRSDAVNSLALSAGCEFFFNPSGGPTVRRVPTINDTPVWTVTSGNPDGVIIEADRELTREETYNVVIVNSAAADAISPLLYTAEDDDPTSSTYVGSAGRIVYVYPTQVDSDRGQKVADTLLSMTRQLIRSVSLTVVCNPALDAGDVITAVLPDNTSVNVLVDSFTIPLGAESSMPLNCRSSAPILDLG